MRIMVVEDNGKGWIFETVHHITVEMERGDYYLPEMRQVDRLEDNVTEFARSEKR